MAQINKSKSLFEFAYHHYLHHEGNVKDDAVKHIDAIARSLKNIYLQDKRQHFHAELMITLFKF